MIDPCNGGLFIVLSTLIQVCYAQQGNAYHGGLSLRLSREYLLALNKKHKPSLPSMILANVRSLNGFKMDE